MEQTLRFARLLLLPGLLSASLAAHAEEPRPPLHPIGERIEPRWTSPVKPFPHLVTVAAQGDSAVVAYIEEREGTGEKLFFRETKDGGHAWTEPVELLRLPDEEYIENLTSIWTPNGLLLAWRHKSDAVSELYTAWRPAGKDAFPPPRITRNFTDEFILAPTKTGYIEMLSWPEDRKATVLVTYRKAAWGEDFPLQGVTTFQMTQPYFNGRQPVLLARFGPRLLAVTGPRFGAIAPIEWQSTLAPEKGAWSPPSAPSLKPETAAYDVWCVATEELVILRVDRAARNLIVSRDGGATFEQQPAPMTAPSNFKMAPTPEHGVCMVGISYPTRALESGFRVTASADGRIWDPVRSFSLGLENPSVVDAAATNRTLVVAVIDFKGGLGVYRLPRQEERPARR